MKVRLLKICSITRGVVFLLAVLGVNVLEGEVTLPAIFGDHMVLQQGMTLPVWGTALPGEVVRVSIAGKKAETTADDQGNWRVILPTLTIANPQTLIVEGRNRLEIQDVLLGDVWICAGDGNMKFPLSDAVGGKDSEVKEPDLKLRFYVAEPYASLRPVHHGAGSWNFCASESVSSVSAVGYFFARDLRSTRHLPIGIIQVTSDEAPLQAWISHRGLSDKPGFSNYLAECQSDAQHLSKFSDPSSTTPTAIFNGMINPLIPYAITGVIWYQGDSSTGSTALEYRRLFPRMIRDWRAHWEQGPFPFYFVMAAGFGRDDETAMEPYSTNTHPSLNSLPWLREGQMCALTLPNTGTAVATDLGDADEIIPAAKLDVGRRLALLERKEIAGEDLVATGPTYLGMQRQGSKVRVAFTSVGKGLTLGDPPVYRDDVTQVLSSQLKGFALSGKDCKWFPATGKIEGDCVILSSDAVPDPVAVRYNWKGFPTGNLYNRDGLPAPPFRTDSYQPEGLKYRLLKHQDDIGGEK